MHQPLPPSTDPVPPSINQYWPSTIMNQPVPPSIDPVPSHINQYRSILTQNHQLSTSIDLYWPSTIMYQPVSTTFYWPITTKYQLLPPSTDPVPSYINQCHSILTQYHQVSTNTSLYSCCFGITDFCTVYLLFPSIFRSLYSCKIDFNSKTTTQQKFRKIRQYVVTPVAMNKYGWM